MKKNIVFIFLISLNTSGQDTINQWFETHFCEKEKVEIPKISITLLEYCVSFVQMNQKIKANSIFDMLN